MILLLALREENKSESMSSNNNIIPTNHSRPTINSQRYFSSSSTDLHGQAERTNRILRRIMNQSPSNRFFRRSPSLFSPPHLDDTRFSEPRGNISLRITPQFNSDPPHPSIPLISPRPIRIEPQPRAFTPAAKNPSIHPKAL